MKRSAVVVALAGMLVAMLGILVPASSSAAAGTSASASSSVVCKLKGARRVVCPTAKLRGPRGPAGVRGPQGPAGPAGPAGGSGPTGVSAFRFLATGDKDNTTITTFQGAVAEASCSVAGLITAARLRGTAGSQNGAASIANLLDNTFTPGLFGSANPSGDFDAGDTIQLTQLPVAGDSGDQWGLVYGSEGGTQTATAHYTAWDLAGPILSTFDCGVVGTVQISS